MWLDIIGLWLGFSLLVFAVVAQRVLRDARAEKRHRGEVERLRMLDALRRMGEQEQP